MLACPVVQGQAVAQPHTTATLFPPLPQRPHLTTASMRLPPASPATRSKGLSPHRQKYSRQPRDHTSTRSSAQQQRQHRLLHRLSMGPGRAP